MTLTRSAYLDACKQLQHGCSYRAVGEVGIFTLPAFSREKGIDHGFSTRTGGVSQGDFASLNLSFTRPEQRENVVENYRIFCKAADIPLESMVMDSYEHGMTVLRVDKRDCGRGYTREPLPPCDGLVSNDPAVTLITGHADCMAFYLYDPVRRCIGLAHAGWRGALGRIGTVLANKLCTEFGSRPEDLLAGVGPSICPSCFEVGEDVAQDFETAFPELPLRGKNAAGRPTIDLWGVAVAQLSEAGVSPERICLSDVCTMEEPRLYSHRRDKGKTGGMSAYLRLLPL